MSKKRYVETSFWDDYYISDLDPSEKLLFLYLLTNPATNIAGVYQILVKRIAADTGFDSDMVRKIMARFEEDEKMVYKDGWLVLINFIKHQKTGGPSVQKGIERSIKNAPEWAIGLVIKFNRALGSIIYPNPNPNPNSDGECKKTYYINDYFFVSIDKHSDYKNAFPDIDIDIEYNKMEIWLDDNPKKRKTDYGRFILGWLNRIKKPDAPATPEEEAAALKAAGIK